MSENKIECKCEQKELCSKMRNEGLRELIEGLEKQLKAEVLCSAMKSVLSTIRDNLSIYGCMPCEALIKRVEYTEQSISDWSSLRIIGPTSESKIMVKSLIAELKAFLENA